MLLALIKLTQAYLIHLIHCTQNGPECILFTLAVWTKTVYNIEQAYAYAVLVLYWDDKTAYITITLRTNEILPKELIWFIYNMCKTLYI